MVRTPPSQGGNEGPIPSNPTRIQFPTSELKVVATVRYNDISERFGIYYELLRIRDDDVTIDSEGIKMGQ